MRRGAPGTAFVSQQDNLGVLSGTGAGRRLKTKGSVATAAGKPVIVAEFNTCQCQDVADVNGAVPQSGATEKEQLRRGPAGVAAVTRSGFASTEYLILAGGASSVHCFHSRLSS